jgi:hypothetical protein
MSQNIAAVFDGMIFRPLEPVTLAPNTRVQITIADAGFPFENPALPSLGMALNSPASGDQPETATAWEDLERYMCENYFYSDFYAIKK